MKFGKQGKNFKHWEKMDVFTKKPRLGPEALRIAKTNRVIAKIRLEANKQKMKHGVPIPNEPFPPLVERLNFYTLH